MFDVYHGILFFEEEAEFMVIPMVRTMITMVQWYKGTMVPYL